MLTPESSRLPYPGLRPFEADEADLFFGREEHVDALLERLSGSHFVAVVGESGAGKSSLVRAGLLPALDAGFVVEAGSDWRVAVMRPGGAPLIALADALLAPGVLQPEGAAAHRDFALAELRRGPLGLATLVRDAHLGRYCNTVIVVDQFEELFRYCREPAQKDQASVFVELLLQASRQRQIPIYVVLTMRSDFVGDCARFRGLPEALNDNQYLTPRLTREQIAAAIREPARVCSGSVDPDLVDELCNAVGDDQDQLPLLQHLLMRLWDRASRETRPPRVTAALSHETGGLRLALNNHAQQVYESLPKPRQAVARALFKTLTEPRSQRRDLRRDALVSEVAAIAGVDAGETIAVADQFRGPGRHMLMPPPAVALDAASRLDISHESLLRQWSSLVEWAREEGASAREFDRLREEARLERDQEGELLSGRDLARALDWKRQSDPTPAWAERYAPAGELDATLAFITKSESEARRKKNDELQAAKQAVAARRARIYIGLTAGALVLASIVTVVIFNLWRQAGRDRDEAIRQTAVAEVHRRQADEQRAEATRMTGEARANAVRAEQASQEISDQKRLAEQKSQEAHASRLTANARLELTRDVSLALLLAREAVLEGTSDPLALRTLRDAIAVQVPSVEAQFPVVKSRNYIPGSGKSYWLDFALGAGSVSPSADLVIAPSGNNAMIWSAVTGRPVRTLRGHEGILASAVFSANGRLAATAGADKTARLWDISSGRLLHTLSHEAMVNGAVFNRDATLLVTLGDDDLAQVWNVRDGAVLQCRLSHKGNFIAASFSKDDTLLATVIHDNGKWSGQVWHLAGAACPRVPVPGIDTMKNLKWASFSDRGGWLGAVTADGVATVWAVPGWKEWRTHVPQVGYRSRDAHAPAESLPPPLAWSHDDRFVATAGGDNTVYLMPLSAGPRTPLELRGHSGRVTSIAFSPADDMVLTTAADNTGRIWTLNRDGAVLERLILSGHKDTVGSGAFSFNGHRVITVSDDGTARSWQPLYALRDLSPASPSDPRLPTPATRSVTGLIKGLWITGPMAATLAARRDELKAATGSWSFHAPRLVEATNAGFVVRDPGDAAGRLLALPPEESARIEFSSPGGRFVVATIGDRKRKEKLSVAVWDLQRSPQPERVDPPSPGGRSTCSAEAISDDGRLAWYCANEDVVLIGRPGQSTPVKIPIRDESLVERLRFSATGRLLAMTLEDDSVRVFDAITGASRPPMRGHDGWITGVDFSRDDRFLVSTSEDTTARVWEVATGIQVAKATTNETDLMGAIFNHDGLSLLIFSPDRLLQWRCYACGDLNGLLGEVQRRQIVRTLSPEEKQRYGLAVFEPAQAPPDQPRHAHQPRTPRQ